tara:strand:+ start:125 stop:496 length:372 start_codon:yes stop_codon:yes gene_type:complete
MTAISVEQFVQFDDDGPLELHEYVLILSTDDDDIVNGIVAESIIDTLDAGYTMDEVIGAAFVGQIITRTVNLGFGIMPLPVHIEQDDLLTLVCYDSGGVAIRYGGDDFWDPGMFAVRFGTVAL